MKLFKILLLVLVGFSVVCDVSTQTKKTKANKKNKTKTTNTMPETPLKTEMKIIAEGSYGQIETPFVFTARSKETYAQLQNLIQELPAATEIDFEKSAVVAAFAGMKNTGGYSVKISEANGKIAIEVIEPGRDMITTDALTYPYQVAIVSAAKEKSLPLALSANWTNALQTYKVTLGSFQHLGGRRGILKNFETEGTIGVITQGENLTLVFNLSGKGAEKNLKLSETASGILKNGRINLAQLDAGNFSDNPQSAEPRVPFEVSGVLEGGKLILEFNPPPTNLADAFEVRGRVEAQKVK